MLFKVFGIFLVIVSTVALGRVNGKRHTDRLRELDIFGGCIVNLENEIRFTQTPFTDAIKKVTPAQKCAISDVFISVASSLEELSGKTFADIWRNVIEDNSKNFFKDDLSLLLSFGECLNNSDVDGQIKCLKLYAKKLADHTERLKAQCENSRKLSQSLGIYSGLLISVLLL